MTKAEIRVQIAKDVISQLKSKKIQAMPGNYGDMTISKDGDKLFEEAWETKNCKIDLQLVFKTRKRCRACALGSMFIAAVDRYNKLSVSVDTIDLFDFQRDRETDYLDRWFSQSQLNLIEIAFEIGECPGVNHRQFNAAALSYSKIKNDTDRLIAIMKNIVKNEGTFVLPKGN